MVESVSIIVCIIAGILAVNHFSPHKNASKINEFIAQNAFDKRENCQCVISGLLNSESYVFDVYRNDVSIILLNTNSSSKYFAYNYLILFDHSVYSDEKKLFTNYVEAEKGDIQSMEITGKLFSKSLFESFNYISKITITF